MAITHGANVRTAIANTIKEAIDNGVANAKFRLKDAGDVVLATVDLQDPAFADAVSGVINLNGTPLQNLSAEASGTITKFDVIDGEDNIIFQGTATTSGGDITISNDAVVTGNLITIASPFQYTASL